MGLEVAAGAQWVTNARNGGSTYDPEGWGYPWRIVFHTVQGGISRSTIEGHAVPPHVWYDPNDRRLYQTVPFSRGSYALQQPDMAHYTNKARALQCELAGRAEDAADWSDLWLARIAQDVVVPMVQYVRSVGGTVDLRPEAVPAPGDIANSASADAPQRLSIDRWATFNSICGHRHVPMNGDRWDCGGLNMKKIAVFAAQMLDPVIEPAAPTDEDEMRAWQISDGAARGAVVFIGGTDCRTVVYPPSVPTWPDMHKALVEMAELGVISKHADGAVFKPITSAAVDILRAAR